MTARGPALPATAATITGTPPAGTVGTAYSFMFTTTGATSFTLTGALPAGLTFNTATCRISGTPASTGSYPITVVASGPGGNSAPLNRTIVFHHPISNWSPNHGRRRERRLWAAVKLVILAA